MEEMLKLILQEVRSINKRLDNVENDVAGLRADVSGVKANQERMQEDIDMMKTDISSLKANQAETNLRLERLEEGQNRMEKKLDAVFDQTANLTEFKTYVIEKIEDISNDIEFLKYKEKKNEEDLFIIKRNFRAIKGI